MTYDLDFVPKALKEWQTLDKGIKTAIKKVLTRRLENPHVSSAGLSGMENCYKIKHRGSGYRLVYAVDDETIIVLVLSVGKRERNKVYKTAAKRRSDK